jgi:hypothetical protein
MAVGTSRRLENNVKMELRKIGHEDGRWTNTGSESCLVAKFYSSCEYLGVPIRRFLGLPSLLSNGYQGALYLGVKRLGREADHSPPSSAEVKE